MATKFAKPLEASQTTHVADMPPLEVVAEGIPAQEHIEPPPVATREAPPAPERRRSWLAWALAGVIGALLVVAGIVAAGRYSSPSTSDQQTGSVPEAEQEYRAGEQGSEVVYSGPLEGPALPYVPNLSIASIAPIAPMSIARIEAIPPMSMDAIESMLIPSIEAIPPMSIPSIPTISFPTATSTFPPMSGPATFPSISIESIPAISFPTFPSIPAISIPSIEAIPPIEIPAFPDM